jgi:hypothetical protein
MYCVKCGQKFSNEKTAFCTNCSTPKFVVPEGVSSLGMAVGQSGVESKPKADRNRRMLVAGIVAGVAVVAVLVAAWFIFGGSDEGEGEVEVEVEVEGEDSASIQVGGSDRPAEVEVVAGRETEPHDDVVTVLGVELLMRPGDFDNLEFISEGLVRIEDWETWETMRAGFVDVYGNLVVPLIYGGAMPFFEGLAGIRVGDWRTGKWGFIDALGNEVIPPRYDEVSSFNEGLAAVRIGDWETARWGFIDTHGNEVVPPRYDEVHLFFEGMAAVRVGDRWGFIDSSGNEVIPPRYDAVGEINTISFSNGFSEGLVAVRIGDRETGRWGFIDTLGDEVVHPRYDEVLAFSEGMAAIRVGDRWGFIDTTGNEIVLPIYDEVRSFSEGMAAVRIGNRVGFIDTLGNEVVSTRYDAAWCFSDGLAVVVVEGRWGFVDIAGNEVIPLRYDFAMPFINGLATVLEDASWSFINTEGDTFPVDVGIFLDMIIYIADGIALIYSFDGTTGFIRLNTSPERLTSTTDLDWLAHFQSILGGPLMERVGFRRDRSAESAPMPEAPAEAPAEPRG